MPRLYCQQWEESEQGWGVRPDGYSLHLTVEAVSAYVEEYWKRQLKREPNVPLEYSRPSGKPYSVEVNDQTYNEVKGSGNGVRSFDRNAPEPLGTKA